MRRLGITLAVLCGILYGASGQEAGIFTHYYLNPVIINPGATGFEGPHEFIFNYRNKWAGFDDSPRTFTLLYNTEVGESVGVGAQFLTDRVGSHRSIMGAGNFAYKFGNNGWQFGAGLQVGFQQMRIDDVLDDPFLDVTDPTLAEATDGVTLFDASVGLHGEYDSTAFFGVSFPNLVRTRLTNISTDFEDPNEQFGFIAYGGYRFFVSENDFSIEPSIAIKNIPRVPFHVDFNVKLSFLDDHLIGGATVSVGEMSRFGLLLGTRIGALRLYYSYDVGFGDFQEHNNGSHEITVHYLLPRKAASQED